VDDFEEKWRNKIFNAMNDDKVMDLDFADADDIPS